VHAQSYIGRNIISPLAAQMAEGTGIRLFANSVVRQLRMTIKV
jgi:hypothetical protein